MEPIPGSKKDRAKRVSYLPDVHRLLPQSPEAEQGVLASFLLAPREVGTMCVEAKLTKAHFHIPAHATIFGVLLSLWDENKPVDFITLTQILRDKNELEAVGGAGFVTDLFTFLPTAANAAYYIETVVEKYTLREVIHVGTKHAALAYDSGEECAEVVAGFERDVFAISGTSQKDTTHTMKALVRGAMGGIQKMYDSRGAITGLETGFPAVDQMLDGLHGAEMIVIAARPSMGKTALAMNMAEHLATNLAKPVAVFSLEMSAAQLSQRLLCSMARVSAANIRKGFLSERDFPALTAAAERLAKAPLHIDDSSGLTILELRAKARRLKSLHGIEALFVDYLQLLRSSSKKAQDNRQIEIAEISNGLKALSKELNIPIVVLAQLNRQVEGRTGDSKGRPRLSDLRESGSIEQDADVVGLLVRDEYYAENEEQREEMKGKATLIIAKQRNGPVGDIPLTFLKEFTRFETRAESP